MSLNAREKVLELRQAQYALKKLREELELKFPTFEEEFRTEAIQHNFDYNGNVASIIGNDLIHNDGYSKGAKSRCILNSSCIYATMLFYETCMPRKN